MSGEQRVRVGLALWPDQHLKTLAELATAAETAGFDDVWWPDHYDAREFSAVLALCAVATSRVRLGTAVTTPLLRHPGILASLFATIDELSDGRAIAGLGPGGYELKTDLAIGTASPIAATRETVAILRGMFAGERVKLPEARVFPLTGAKLAFQTRADIPVWLAGRGPKMIELAGELADGVIVHGFAEPYLRLIDESVRAGAERGGRSPDACEVAMMFEVSLAPTRQEAMDDLRVRSLVMVGGEYAENLIPLYGLDPDEVKPVRAALRARDPEASRLVTDDMVEAFAVGGTEDQVVDRLHELVGRGLRSFILSPGRNSTREKVEALGRVVKKAFPDR